jgi:hypothetical protein
VETVPDVNGFAAANDLEPLGARAQEFGHQRLDPSQSVRAFRKVLVLSFVKVDDLLELVDAL